MSDSAWNPFDGLTDVQKKQLDAYQELLLRFNKKINLISPDSESSFGTSHLLHCLSLTYRDFPEGSTIVDWGTGGGLPAIPLAICYPDAEVHAVDSVGKKVRAVRTITRRLGLQNCYPWHGRAEEWPGAAHYSVSRATAPLADLWAWHCRAAADPPASSDAHWAPGLVCLKGGDLTDEIEALHGTAPNVRVEERALRPLLQNGEAFDTKAIVSVHASRLED